MRCVIDYSGHLFLYSREKKVSLTVTVQPLTLNSVEEPTPGPPKRGIQKVPSWEGLRVGELLPLA